VEKGGDHTRYTDITRGERKTKRPPKIRKNTKWTDGGAESVIKTAGTKNLRKGGGGERLVREGKSKGRGRGEKTQVSST